MSKAAKITITHVRPPADPAAPLPPVSPADAAGVGLPGGLPGPGVSAASSIGASALPPMPRLGPLDTTLAKFEGKRAHLFHPRNDHGDRLAELAAEAMLAAAGVWTVRNPEKADVLVVGSGGMADDFKGGFEPIESFARRFPVKPLCVLPSSFHLHAADVARVFMSRIEPAFVYARDPHSIDILDSLRIPWPVSIGLDHDVAFNFTGTEFFTQLLATRSEGYVLVVEARDAADGEPQRKSQRKSPAAATVQFHDVLQPPAQAAGPPPPSSTSPPDDGANPGPGDSPEGVMGRLRGIGRRMTSALGRHHWPPGAAQTPFARSAAERVIAELPKLAALPVYADDLSRPDVCSFARFAELVAGAAAVATDRLPVAILATLLDKPTWVRPGTYHKTRGVFRHSLAQQRNVRLI